MNFAQIVDFFSNMIYPLQAITALQGAYLCIVVFRRIAQKRFRSAAAEDEFLSEVRSLMQDKRFDSVTELCDSPPYWSKAVPQLILVALQNRDRPVSKLRQMMAERFEQDILSDLENRIAWINTVVKIAPMLGLQGTVLGMIAAFAKIASAGKTGVDPTALANDISFALFTTAIGLMVAIPLVMALASIHVRQGKLQDSVQYMLGTFLEDYDAVTGGPTQKAS
jgi:biopolymer transport protein ExbB/TolQ